MTNLFFVLVATFLVHGVECEPGPDGGCILAPHATANSKPLRKGSVGGESAKKMLREDPNRESKKVQSEASLAELDSSNPRDSGSDPYANWGEPRPKTKSEASLAEIDSSAHPRDSHSDPYANWGAPTRRASFAEIRPENMADALPSLGTKPLAPFGGGGSEDPLQVKVAMVRTDPKLVRTARPQELRSNKSIQPTNAFVETAEATKISAGTKSQTRMLPAMAMSGGSRMCGLAMVFGFMFYLWKKLGECCCGERSCWYWECCDGARMATGVDGSHACTLKVTIHRARDLKHPSGTPYFVAIIPKRKGKKSKPVLQKDDSDAKTGISRDGRWEEELEVEVPQGHAEVQVALFKPPEGITSSFKGVKCEGFATLKTEMIVNEGPFMKKSCTLMQDAKLKDSVGSVILSIEAVSSEPQSKRKSKKRQTLLSNKSLGGLQSSDGRSSKASDEDDDGETSDEDCNSVEGLSIDELQAEISQCMVALKGPLEVTDAMGDYRLRHFCVREKNGIFSWNYYTDRSPPKGAKPEGRIPFILIQGVSIVREQKSISEFALKYKDSTGVVVTKIMQRTDRPRDQWIRDINRMLKLTREYKIQKKRLEKEKSETVNTANAANVTSPVSAPTPRSSKEGRGLSPV